jgi:DNA-directed RNA polymerase subunit M
MIFMEFCSACGSRMVPKKVGGRSLLQLVCPKCDKIVQTFSGLPSELRRAINHGPKQFVTVIDKNKNLNVLPTIDKLCPKCGNGKTLVWQVQTRGNDESSTQFMRCTKCEYTFRESS